MERAVAKFTMPFHVICEAHQSVGKPLRQISIIVFAIKGKGEFSQRGFDILGVHERNLSQPAF
jgi:hypothetical protein